MNMELPRNILSLYEKNRALLESMQYDPEVDDPLMLCNKEAYNKTGLLDEDMVEQMFSGNQRPYGSDGRSIPKHIGMILIRPDMIHAAHEFEKFITAQYSIIHTENIALDAKTYWNIYKHDFYRPETMHCRLTRAAVYIGSVSRLILFKQNTYSDDDPPLADHVYKNLKGVQGKRQQGTLRGEIVFNNALKLGLHKLDQTIDDRLKIATDPFRAYRHLAGLSEELKVEYEFPLLFYTGVGVHVPSAQEIQNDAVCLLGPDLPTH